MAILQDLLDIEKAVLGAVNDLADDASDVVVSTLKGAAEGIRNVIDAVKGED